MLNVWVVNFKLSLQAELPQERKKDCLFFTQASLKLLKKFSFEFLILLKFSKNWNPCLVTHRCTDDKADASEMPPCLVNNYNLLPAFWIPVPRDPSDFTQWIGHLLPIIHLPCQTRWSSGSWIHSFHFTLLSSKAQIGFSNTWPPLLHHVHHGSRI